MYNNQEIALRIKQIAKEKKISIKQLLENCNLNVNYISQFSNGRDMTAGNLYSIAKCLDVSVDYLLGRTDEPHTIGGHSIQTGSVGDNSSNNDTIVKISDSMQKSFDEMSTELLKKFNELSFDEKLEVFNYIKNIKVK